MERSARTVPVALLALWLAAGAAVQLQTYLLQPDPGSTLELKVYKTGLMSGKVHTFVFRRFEGAVEFDPAAPEQTSVRFRVQADSIECLDDWVSEKDRAKILQEARGPMLAVDQYPRLVFEADGLAPDPDGGFSTEGRLTIRDRTNPVNVKVDVTETGGGLTITGTARVSLDDYGLKPPSAALGMIGTKSVMDVRFSLHASPGTQ
jgi:polyisoprenoid-binding protein YceI